MKPHEFPMPFKESLRIIVGGRSIGIRLKIFRRFWAFELKKIFDARYIDMPQIQTDEQRLEKANEMIKEFTRVGIDKYWFNSMSTGIPEWRRQNNIQQRRNAAKSRWQIENKKR
jgi:hypothetical protein